MNRFIATITPTFTNAACKNHDPNIWFDGDTKQQAISICQTCPELEPCRQYAISLPDDTIGIFAGLTPAKLKPLRKAHQRPPVIDHGTYRGYMQHHRAGIEPCEACRQAHAEYHLEGNRRYKQRERQKRTVAGNFEHGTHAGYTKHYLYGTPPCDDCKKAKAEYMRQRYTKK